MIDLKKRLGQKLSCHQDDQCGDHGLYQYHYKMIGDPSGQQIVADNLCHQYTIDNQSDVIPDQHGRNKIIGIPEE